MTNASARDIAALQRLTRDLLAVAMTTVQEISDVSMPQMRLLFAVSDAGSAPCGALAHQLGVAGSSVTRLADRMVAAGYLDRRHSAENRSVVLLSLTASGTAVIDAVVERRARIFRAALGKLDPPTRAGLLAGLDGLHAALDTAAQPAGR